MAPSPVQAYTPAPAEVSSGTEADNENRTFEPHNNVIFAGAGLVALRFLGSLGNVGRMKTRIRGRPSGPFRSLAVLPLADLSSGPAEDYFADEMSEELITQFLRLGNLKVVSRTSIMQYKGAHERLPQIVRQLAGDATVEGAVRLWDNRVRTTAQLVSAESHTHLWAEDYDRDIEQCACIAERDSPRHCSQDEFTARYRSD